MYEYLETLKFLDENEKSILLEDLFRNKKECDEPEKIRLICLKYLILYYGERHKKHISVLLFKEHKQSLKKTIPQKSEISKENIQEKLISVCYPIYNKISENKILFTYTLVEEALKKSFLEVANISYPQNAKEEPVINKNEDTKKYLYLLNTYPSLTTNEVKRCISFFNLKERNQLLFPCAKETLKSEFEAIVLAHRRLMTEKMDSLEITESITI